MTGEPQGDNARGRLIAIGDIHGYSAALDGLLEVVRPRPEDTLVFLGDYVDRGPDSRGVIDRLTRLCDACSVVTILGNHDEMMLACHDDRRAFLNWLVMGGSATLDSYGGESEAKIPDSHLEFLEECLEVYETERYFFVHAMYVAELSLDQQPGSALRWEGLRDSIPKPHRSGKIAIVGHTSQRSGEILDLGHIICIDTYCYGGGWLTALDVQTGEVWQVSREGVPRENPPRLDRLSQA